MEGGREEKLYKRDMQAREDIISRVLIGELVLYYMEARYGTGLDIATYWKNKLCVLRRESMGLAKYAELNSEVITYGICNFPYPLILRSL